VVDVDIRNAQSCRAFEKAGFYREATVWLRDENFARQVLRLEAP
jgi:RimJ/RimL family protein N-acetyltransferase